MKSIFSNSKIAKLVGLDSLSDWEPYKSLGFWFVLGTLALFGASLLIIKKAVPNYCIMDNLDAKKNPKKKHMFTAAFVVSGRVEMGAFWDVLVHN